MKKKAIISKDLVKMFGVTCPLKQGQEIEVEHFAHGYLYKITSPVEFADFRVHKDYIDFLPQMQTTV